MWVYAVNNHGLRRTTCQVKIWLVAAAYGNDFAAPFLRNGTLLLGSALGVRHAFAVLVHKLQKSSRKKVTEPALGKIMVVPCLCCHNDDRCIAMARNTASTNVLRIRNCSAQNELMTLHALGRLAGSQRTLVHMQQRAVG